MSSDVRAPLGDALSNAIREKVAEANRLQRHLSEATVRCRAVLDSLRPVLDEIAAYMHRETSLDVGMGHSLPPTVESSLHDSSGSRTAAEYREVVIPTFPPTLMMGGFQVQANIDGSVQILPFWTTTDGLTDGRGHTWSEILEGGASDQTATAKHAAESLYAQRHTAAGFLLDTLGGVPPASV